MPKILRIPVILLTLAAVACGSGEEGGDGGAAGAAGASGSGGTEPVVEPAKMVQLPAGFWIDTTEVTRAQYRAWLQTKPTFGGQPPECSWNDDYTPGCHWPAGEEPNHPVVCVDWCDAYAYCQGVGKRLCGKIGGGPNGIDDYADATTSQWYYACSSGGLYEYPYGNEYDPQACNLEDAGLESIAAVASFEGCQSSESGFEGVFDLCGNVVEWVDACGGSGEDDGCLQHDGSFASTASPSRCGLAAAWNRTEKWEGLGFRCCRD